MSAETRIECWSSVENRQVLESRHKLFPLKEKVWELSSMAHWMSVAGGLHFSLDCAAKIAHIPFCRYTRPAASDRVPRLDIFSSLA